MNSACKGPMVESKRCSAFLKKAVCAYYYIALLSQNIWICVQIPNSSNIVIFKIALWLYNGSSFHIFCQKLFIKYIIKHTLTSFYF